MPEALTLCNTYCISLVSIEKLSSRLVDFVRQRGGRKGGGLSESAKKENSWRKSF